MKDHMVRKITLVAAAMLLLILNVKSQDRQLELLGLWQDTTLVGSRFYNNAYNEIWGLVVNGREFAVIGSTDGTHFIDVTDPTEPTQVQYVPGRFQGDGVVHRDYHDYKGYLYAVCDEGPSTMQIMDITMLPDTVKVVYDSNEFFARSHNIFIDTSQAKLYIHLARGGNSPNAPMQMLDISVPDTPKFIKAYYNFGPLAVSQVHDGYIKDNLAYLNCGPSGFALVDFTDPQIPITLSVLTPNDYAFAGYNHSGWPSCDDRYYYMADENHGYPMKIINMEDPENLVVEGLFDAMFQDTFISIPHNQLVACNYLYVAYYYDGLKVFDISDPVNPKYVANYRTSSVEPRQSYEGAWGVYPFLPSGNILVSDMQEGLFVLEPIGDNCYSAPVCGQGTWTNDISLFELEIYPNPSNGDYLQWQGLEVNGGVQLDIHDLFGRKLFTKNYNQLPEKGSIEFNTSFAPGHYIVQISSGKSRYTATWVVMP